MFDLFEFIQHHNYTENDVHPNHGDKYYDVKACKDCGSDADVEYFDRHLCEECLKDYD